MHLSSLAFAERASQLQQEAKRHRSKIAHLESQCLRLSIDRITFNSLQQRERESSLQQIVRDLSKKAAKLESQALRMTIDHIRADRDKVSGTDFSPFQTLGLTSRRVEPAPS